MLRQRKNNNTAQVFVEYTIILGIVAMALISMNVLIKRGIQGMVKTVADQIGTQANAEQTFNDDSAGYLEGQYSSTRASIEKATTDRAGNIEYTFNQTVTTTTNTVSKLGFTEEK